MPSFTLNLQNLVAMGPIVEVIFSPTQAAVQAIQSAKQPMPAPLKSIAMVDTGATTTVVTPQIAQHLGLQPIGQIPMVTPTTSTPVMSNQYAVDLHFPINGVQVRNVVVSEAGLIGQHIQCLIGRDVLQHGVLVYIGYMNQFTLSF
jgi:predicted aspartyl protease